MSVEQAGCRCAYGRRKHAQAPALRKRQARVVRGKQQLHRKTARHSPERAYDSGRGTEGYQRYRLMRNIEAKTILSAKNEQLRLTERRKYDA